MLNRITPPASVSWSGMPRATVELARKHGADLDRLDWSPTEERAFSNDLLRIAVRYGIATTTGIAFDMTHAANVGHADRIRTGRIATDHARADLHETASMQELYRMFPGTAEDDAERDARLREDIEGIARDSDRALAQDLRAPIRPELVEHWRRLGGWYPD